MRAGWSGSWPLPRSVQLPGCRVRVLLWPPDKLPLGGTTHGLYVYDVEKDIAAIYIDKTAPLPVQRYILIHELDHALNELRDVMLEYHLDQVHPHAAREVKLCDTTLSSPSPESPGSSS